MKADITLVAAPLRKQVIELLYRAIVELEYMPGDRLVERELCERYSVSRTVIREALRHLEAEGLVNLVPNRGPVVALTSPEEASALFEVREALESLAARLCARRATRADVKALSRAYARVKAAYEKDDLLEKLNAKDNFYRALCEGAKNPVITSTLRSIQARVQMLRALSLRTPGRADDSLRELAAIVAAIENGDEDASAELAALHVRRAGETALPLLEQEDVGVAIFGPVGQTT